MIATEDFDLQMFAEASDISTPVENSWYYFDTAKCWIWHSTEEGFNAYNYEYSYFMTHPGILGPTPEEEPELPEPPIE